MAFRKQIQGLDALCRYYGHSHNISPSGTHQEDDFESKMYGAEDGRSHLVLILILIHSYKPPRLPADI